MRKHLLTLGIAVAAFLGGNYLGPKKTQIKEVEKIVYRESVDSKTNSKRTVVKKEVKRPDGTIEIETSTSIDRSTDKKTDVTLDRENSKEVKTDNRSDWRLNANYYPEIIGIQDKSAAFDLQRRILGELYIGLSVNTQKQLGISFGIGF
jgi:uncharacterized membrane protein YfhO